MAVEVPEPGGGHLPLRCQRFPILGHQVEPDVGLYSGRQPLKSYLLKTLNKTYKIKSNLAPECILRCAPSILRSTQLLLFVFLLKINKHYKKTKKKFKNSSEMCNCANCGRPINNPEADPSEPKMMPMAFFFSDSYDETGKGKNDKGFPGRPPKPSSPPNPPPGCTYFAPVMNIVFQAVPIPSEEPNANQNPDSISK